MAARTRAQRYIELREHWESLARELRAQRLFSDERTERQTLGRIQTLENVAAALRAITDEMKPAQVQAEVECLLDVLDERNVIALVRSIRERHKYHINQLGEWMGEGALAQIGEIVPQLLSRLPPRWHASSSKMHGRSFQVYHSQDPETMFNYEKGIHHWQNPERVQWYEEVALLQLNAPERQLDEVYRLTQHRSSQHWQENREVVWGRNKDMPRSTCIGDVLVSLLSGAAWIITPVGFQQLSVTTTIPHQEEVDHASVTRA